MAEMASDIKAKRTGEMSASADELFRFINRVRSPRRDESRGCACAAARRDSFGTPRAQHRTPPSRTAMQVRAGTPVDSNELVKFARLFNDELTLDRLDRWASQPGDQQSLSQRSKGSSCCVCRRRSGCCVRGIITVLCLCFNLVHRVQLVSMCQLLSIPPFGTDAFLRNRLRSHLDKTKMVRFRAPCGRYVRLHVSL